MYILLLIINLILINASKPTQKFDTFNLNIKKKFNQNNNINGVIYPIGKTNFVHLFK